MKAYLVTTLVVDHDDVGASEVAEVLESTRFANHCISPRVASISEFDIGEWDDGHPLNRRDTNIIAYLTSTLMPK